MAPLLLALAAAACIPRAPRIEIVLGVSESGAATERWLAMIRRRLPTSEFEAVAPLRKPFTGTERAWVALVRSRAAGWEREIPSLARLFAPAGPPPLASIVIGNRGGSDAFTHDPTTIGFDVASLQAAYGDASLPANTARLDRFFRHEYVHLLQKALLADRPYPAGTPIRDAALEMWGEGLGNYFSFSERWDADTLVARVLAVLEPRLVARLAALACASPAAADQLTADLSNGPFEEKWGALPVALWLRREAGRSPDALRHFAQTGPDAVWALADRYLPQALAAAVREARLAEARCHDRGPQARADSLANSNCTSAPAAPPGP